MRHFSYAAIKTPISVVTLGLQHSNWSDKKTRRNRNGEVSEEFESSGKTRRNVPDTPPLVRLRETARVQTTEKERRRRLKKKKKGGVYGFANFTSACVCVWEIKKGLKNSKIIIKHIKLGGYKKLIEHK